VRTKKRRSPRERHPALARQIQGYGLDAQAFMGLSRVCVECGRRFDLHNEVAADEWYCGHDCEVS